MVLCLSSSDVLRKGLDYVGFSVKGHQQRMTEKAKLEKFHSHFGSWPFVLASMWSDLCTTDIEEAHLEEKEKGERGFKRFMMAHYFLWEYPKNMDLMGSRFDVCKRSLQGVDLWRWPRKIAALKAIKIVWDERFNDPETEIIQFSLDSTDCRCTEKKHPQVNKDNMMCSHKHKKPAWRYEILMAILEPKILWINGPFKAGEDERGVFRQKGLKAKLQSIPGKLTVADAGYQSSYPDEIELLSVPNPIDSKALAKFKSRIRCRHETWNGRIKFFSILEDRFRHSMACHKIAFEAVAVIVQYQMDNGAPIFSV
jgi:hypothetical protein